MNGAAAKEIENEKRDFSFLILAHAQFIHSIHKIKMNWIENEWAELKYVIIKNKDENSAAATTIFIFFKN